MRKCENGCCSFGPNWKDEDIYCASRAPDKIVVEKQLNQLPQKRKQAKIEGKL